MIKEYTCIICPNGCDIKVQIDNNKIIFIKGASCKKGQEYVKQEVLFPMRTITTSILVIGGTLPLVSVRLSCPIPKDKIFAVMNVIKKVILMAPCNEGDIAIENVLGLGSDVIVSKNIKVNKPLQNELEKGE